MVILLLDRTRVNIDRSGGGPEGGGTITNSSISYRKMRVLNPDASYELGLRTNKVFLFYQMRVWKRFSDPPDPPPISSIFIISLSDQPHNVKTSCSG